MLAAALFSATLVAGAYLLARGVPAPPSAEASTETALLAALATRDSSGDGLPDWEKALYGIPLDATTTDYFRLGMTDGEAVARGLIVPKAIADVPTAAATGTPVALPGVPAPAGSGTLTDTFAKNFFTLYLAAKQANGGAALSRAQLSAVADNALNGLASSVMPAPDFKSAADLAVSGTGAAALESYAALAENVMRAQGANLPKSELEYLQDAVNGDAGAVGNIEKLAKAYRDTAAGIAALPAPAELSAPVLALVNAMARIGEAASDFAREEADPVAAMLALKQYPGAVRALANAFQEIHNAYASEDAAPPEGAAGYFFVNVATGIYATSTAL